MARPKTPKARNVLDHLSQASPLARLLATRAEQLAIEQVLPVVLGAELAQHFRVTNRTESTLTLTSSSGARVSRLRYDAEALLQKFRTIPALAGLTRVEIRTSPAVGNEQSLARPITPTWKARRPSGESAKALEAAALACTHDRLRAVLNRLAKLSTYLDED